MRLLKQRHVKRLIIAALIIFIIAGITGGTYVLRAYITKNFGITLTPSKNFSESAGVSVKTVTYYLQNDPAWADEAIGRSSYKMGGAGCLISCVAAAATELGTQITPQELNSKLTAVDGYQNGADLIWYKINDAVPEVDYTYSRVFSSATIERDLRNGLLPVIKVKYHGGGIQHWLLVLGAKDGEFLVYDPLNAKKEPIPLSTHGKVYAYRVLNTTDE